MAEVISGSTVQLRLRDDRSPQDWTAEVLVGDPDNQTEQPAVRGRADAAWADGWWTADVVVTGPPGVLKSQWILRKGGVPTIVSGEAVYVRAGLLTVDVNQWYRDKGNDQAWVRSALDAARETLAVSAGSSDLSVSVDGYSATFESRSDLLSFIGKLERRLRGGRRPEMVLEPC